MHPAKEGFASLPFFDEFDLSTVDILLISQYVRSLSFIRACCHADIISLECLPGVLYTERIKAHIRAAPLEEDHTTHPLYLTACISEKQYNIFSLTLSDICPPVRPTVKASRMVASISQPLDPFMCRDFQFYSLAEIANV